MIRYAVESKHTMMSDAHWSQCYNGGSFLTIKEARKFRKEQQKVYDHYNYRYITRIVKITKEVVE